MSETEKKELSLEQRERNIRLREIEIDCQLKNIESAKSSMKSIYQEHAGLTDTQTIKKMADKFIEQVRNTGEHLCIHDKDWGTFTTSLANIEKNTNELIREKNEHAERIQALETKWKVSVGIIMAVIAGSWMVFTFTFEQLKALIMTLANKG